jgi:c-di-GMP-related signal transduction protein
MSQDPVLVYRFLAHANSPTLGLQSGIDSLRRALMMIGYASLDRWLQQQLPTTVDDVDLKPIKTAIVLRARLMEMLLDAGEEEELRREVYLCGLFSQMDTLLGEPLGTALQTLPLSERLYDATVAHTGPYEPSLAIACAMENEDTVHTRRLCEEHEMDIEEVNRVLLRALAALYVSPANGEFGERRRRSRSRAFGS